MKTFKNIPSFTLPIAATAASGQAFVFDGYFNCMETEIWKDVKGYEGRYIVSNLGNIISIDYRKRKTRKYLTPTFNKRRGYLSVMLSFNNNQKRITVHRLVATAFHDNPENKSAVNHIDCDKRNNKANNLEWVTSKENNHHAIKMGRININLSKTKRRDILEIRKLRNSGVSCAEIAKKFDVHLRTIFRIAKKDTWANVK